MIGKRTWASLHPDDVVKLEGSDEEWVITAVYPSHTQCLIDHEWSKKPYWRAEVRSESERRVVSRHDVKSLVRYRVKGVGKFITIT